MVITHFPPTLEAIDQALYKDNALNPYFINDCEWLGAAPESDTLGVRPYPLPVRLPGGRHTRRHQPLRLQGRDAPAGVFRDEDGGGLSDG